MRNISNHIEISNKRSVYLIISLLGITPFFFNGVINSKIHGSHILYWTFEIITWVAIPLFLIFLVTRVRDFEFRDLGFHSSIMKQESVGVLILTCIGFAPVCYWTYSFTVKTVTKFIPPGGFFHYESVIPDTGILQLFVVVYFALTAGFVEEIFMRGMLYRALSDFQNSAAIFLLVSPILFSLIHWENGVASIVSTYVFGVLMAVAFLIFRNIWPLIIGHTYTDLIWFSQ